MPLSLLLDKSTFQMLHMEQMLVLHRYYNPNVTPILVTEVLGDLSKEVARGTPADKVAAFARKLLPHQIAVNVDYRSLIEGELLGHPVAADFRPQVGNGTHVRSASGGLGVRIGPSAEEEALSRWREREFTDIEALTAELWRKTTRNPDVLRNLKSALKEKLDLKQRIGNLDGIQEHTDRLLQSSANQENLLQFALAEFAVSAESATKAYSRWQQECPVSFEHYAPYVYHCCRVRLFFLLALAHDIDGIGRKTDDVDLEYLYYLPFCRIFTSNDGFHKKLAPFFITAKQDFITGDALQKDLKAIIEYCETLSEEKHRSRVLKEPPQIPSLLTYQLWAKYFLWPNPGFHDPRANDIEYHRKKARELYDVTKTGTPLSSSGEPDFLVVERAMNWNDPCPCKSGLSLLECLPKHAQVQ